jgi:predicted nuclease of restriction endonuclease-like RecB superfamily
MLPTELLIHRQNGEAIAPKRLTIDNRNIAIACDLIDCFTEAVGSTQGKLDQQLIELEGDRPDFRIIRGLAHLLKSDAFSKFEVISPLEPQELRERVYTLAAKSVPSPQASEKTLETLANALSQELNREVLPVQICTGLYADLQENRILTQFDAPIPEALLHRYNLSQVQGVFYRASQITLNAHRNVPGEYKLLFRYLKLFQLMAYIEGDADHGFTITVDGPTSLFKPSTRYGLAIAKLLPALLHVTKWSLTATLQTRDFYTGAAKTGRFSLNSDCGLVTHYPPGKPYDSMLEASFANRWDALKTDWVLEREVDLIPIPGSVMIPDFRLVHADGRTFLLEIVGYWRPEYLQKKFSQVRQSGCDNLILAISERLNLEKAGVKVKDTPAKVVWFKDKLSPKAVLEALD